MAYPSAHAEVVHLIDLLGQLEGVILRCRPSVAWKIPEVQELWTEFAQLAAKLGSVANQHQVSWRHVLRIATRTELQWRLAKEEASLLESALRPLSHELPPPSDDASHSKLLDNPADKKAYRPASKIIADHYSVAVDIKTLNRILKEHPEIRRWKPSKYRLLVHIVDWQVYVDQQSPRDRDNPEEIEHRKADMYQKKHRK